MSTMSISLVSSAKSVARRLKYQSKLISNLESRAAAQDLVIQHLVIFFLKTRIEFTGVAHLRGSRQIYSNIHAARRMNMSANCRPGCRAMQVYMLSIGGARGGRQPVHKAQIGGRPAPRLPGPLPLAKGWRWHRGGQGPGGVHV